MLPTKTIVLIVGLIGVTVVLFVVALKTNTGLGQQQRAQAASEARECESFGHLSINEIPVKCLKYYGK